MQTLIAEQPLTMTILLGVIAAAALFGWLQSGKKEPLYVGLVFLALIPVGWIVSVRWVTDREQIRGAIETTAEAVKRNDFDTAVLVIDPALRPLITSAKADLSRFQFTDARVNKLRSIDMIQGSDPPEAEVDLSVTVVASDQSGQFQNIRVLRRVILRFRRSDNGRWYVYDYNHMPIAGPSDNFSPSSGLGGQY